MKHNQIAIKSGIVIAWIALILLFLFAPKIKHFLRGKPTKSINVYVWTDEISSEMLDKFQEETGIEVYLSYFETNEELFAKMQYTKGAGYDLIMPSGFMIPNYIEKGLLQKIDKQKLNFLQYMNPNVVNKYFDPHNEYSIPFHLDITCIGYDKRYYPTPPPANWDIIFDKKKGAPRIGMTNDARESVLLAAKYLFGTTMHLTPENVKQLSHFLHQQKPRVAAYTDLRADYLIASGSAQAAVSQTSFIIRAMEDNKNLGLLIPRKTFAMIDSFVIPQASDNQELVYEFLNFLFRPDVIAYHLKKYLALPTITYPSAQNFLKHYNLDTIDWSHISFFRTNLSSKTINKIWLELKSY
jgi:spermidine/putrescine transport system substrate-binding protein